MPNWSPQPPENATPYAYRILRTPPKGTFTAIAVCAEIVGTNTHFAYNRTIPCERPNACKLCDDGFSWRWHGYLGSLVIATMEPCIFEFTANTAKTFQAYVTQYGNLRGCGYQARRPSERPNGRVVVACKPADLQRVNLPEPFDVARILCHIWNIKYEPDNLYAGRSPRIKGIAVPPENGDGRYGNL